MRRGTPAHGNPLDGMELFRWAAATLIVLAALGGALPVALVAGPLLGAAAFAALAWALLEMVAPRR